MATITRKLENNELLGLIISAFLKNDNVFKGIPEAVYPMIAKRIISTTPGVRIGEKEVESFIATHPEVFLTSKEQDGVTIKIEINWDIVNAATEIQGLPAITRANNDISEDIAQS